MTKEEMEAAIAKANADTAKANKLAELNDAQKAHYNTLAETDKEAFLAKSADERTSIIKNLADANPVVYKSESTGAEFRKNDDPRMVAMAKASDEDRKLAKAATEALADATLQKRADEEFKNLPGTSVEKAALLKSIDAIPDETVRKAALASVKAGDNALSSAYVRKGHGGGGADDEASPEAKLDALAKAHDATHKVGYHKAYEAVCKTKEGEALYVQTTVKH